MAFLVVTERVAVGLPRLEAPGEARTKPAVRPSAPVVGAGRSRVSAGRLAREITTPRGQKVLGRPT